MADIFSPERQKDKLQMVVSNQIELVVADVPPRVLNGIYERLTLDNPKYEAALRQDRSVYGIPERIQLYREEHGKLTLPRGCGKWLQELLISHEVPFTAVDRRLELEPVVFQSRIQTRPYQEDAIQALVAAKQGGVVAPCGAGKTMVLLEAMARIGQPVLDLTEDEIGRLYGGKSTIGTRFTVCLVQTLNKLDIDALKDKFGAILVDEAHHLAATTFFHPVGQFPAKFRLWASATPERSDGLTEMVYAGAGPIVHQIDQAEVPTVTPELRVIETNFFMAGDDYVQLMGHVTRNKDRNDLLVKTITETARGHYSLVLSDRVEHLQILRVKLQEALPDLNIEILTGSMKKRDRSDVMERVNAKQVDILLATQLAREGLDIQHLDHLYLVTPKRAAGAVQQEVGRIMRTHPSKTEAVVFDFWDSQSPILKQQFWKRREVYQKLGMDVKFNARRRAAK